MRSSIFLREDVIFLKEKRREEGRAVGCQKFKSIKCKKDMKLIKLHRPNIYSNIIAFYIRNLLKKIKSVRSLHKKLSSMLGIKI